MKRITVILIILFLLFSCSDNKDELKIIDTILNDEGSYFYTNLTPYKVKNNKLPIGIFDSGTGGLTVFDAIVNFDKYSNNDHSFVSSGDSTRDFNAEKFIYLADQANMPYGNYGAQNKSLLLKEHVVKDAQFLLSNNYYATAEDKNIKNDKAPIKALVIACNTATAYAKEDIERFIKKANLNIKVIGVIGAGVRAALENVAEKDKMGVGVMATAGTVSSKGYVKEIEKQNKAGNVVVYQQAGVGLAGAIDGAQEFINFDATEPSIDYKGPSDKNNSLIINNEIIARYNFDWANNHMLFDGSIDNPSNIQINSVDNYIAYHVTSLLEKIISSQTPTKLEKIILGCTHYPFYTEKFESKIEELINYSEDGNYIYRSFLSHQVDFIDPALFTARELYEYLAKEKLFNESDIEDSEFYISVPNIENKNIIVDESGRFTYDYKYGRQANEIQQYVKRVPFSRRNIPSTISKRLETKIPFTYSLIRNFNSQNPKTIFLSDKERL